MDMAPCGRKLRERPRSIGGTSNTRTAHTVSALRLNVERDEQLATKGFDVVGDPADVRVLTAVRYLAPIDIVGAVREITTVEILFEEPPAAGKIGLTSGREGVIPVVVVVDDIEFPAGQCLACRYVRDRKSVV